MDIFCSIIIQEQSHTSISVFVLVGAGKRKYKREGGRSNWKRYIDTHQLRLQTNIMAGSDNKECLIYINWLVELRKLQISTDIVRNKPSCGRFHLFSGINSYHKDNQTVRSGLELVKFNIGEKRSLYTCRCQLGIRFTIFILEQGEVFGLVWICDEYVVSNF